MDFRFSGRFAHSLDDKGRLALPSLLRDELQKSKNPDDLTALADKAGHVTLYPHESWENLLAQIEDIKDRSLREAAIALYCGPAKKVTLDKAGRALIPPDLRAEAGLTREIKINGCIFKIEIWDTGRLERRLVLHEARREEIENLGLKI